MPQFNPNAINALRNLQSPSNLSGQRSMQELDIIGGLGGFEPSELELKLAQRKATDTFTDPSGEAPVGAVPWALGGGGSAVRGTSQIPGGSYTPSRQDLRDMLMGEVSKKLMFGDIAHRQAMEQEIIPRQLEGEYGLQEAQIKGGYDVAAQKAGQAAAMDRLLATQEAISQRTDRNNQADIEQAIQNAQNRMELEKFRQGAINERQGADSGWLTELFRMLTGGGSEPQPQGVEPTGATPQEAPRRRIISVR